MSNYLLQKTAKISFGLQIVTGIIDYIALRVEIPSELFILKQLLFLELMVQIIEGIFYYWLLTRFRTGISINNITVYRYIDWMFTTPTMLFTLMMYISHLNNKHKKLGELVKENKTVITNVISLNFLMLYFGYLGEIGKLPVIESVYLGFIPFILYYKMIYDNFIKDPVTKEQKTTKEGIILFWYFFIFWGLYGIAALFPYGWKNISYNILDLFSKNFFGLFLSYIVFKSRIN